MVQAIAKEYGLRQHFHIWLCWAFLGWVLVALMPRLSVAQKTITKDAGAGAKEKVDYDARGQIVESRTIGADGKLLVKINYSPGAGFEKEKQTSTSYWPDGKSVQKVAQTTFDEGLNFISEIVEDYNQSGKHVSGHQLFHDPITGIYRCFDWNVAQQKYAAIDCPAPEESHEGPHEVRKITREEVMQQLAAARRAAQAEQKAVRMKPKGPVQAPITTTNKGVEVILPVCLRPGQQVSGRVVEDPDRFAGQSELMAIRVTLPMESAGDAAQLSGWTFELKGSEPQPADGRISFVVPSVTGPMEFTLRQAGDPSIAVSRKVRIPKTTCQEVQIPKSYESATLCFKGELCVVTGRFSGDSHNTFAAFDSVPVSIVAETDRAAYLEVPVSMNLGPAMLFVAEGTKVEAMMMVVAELGFATNHEAIQAGQDTVTALRVDGVQELSDEQWHYGVYPASNLEKARALVPGFNPVKIIERDRELREKQEKQDGLAKKDDERNKSAGMVLVVVRNATPDVVSIHGSKRQNFGFHLTPESFAMGEFKYNIVVDGLKAGTFVLNATAVPFLAPVKAQEFEDDHLPEHTANQPVHQVALR